MKKARVLLLHFIFLSSMNLFGQLRDFESVPKEILNGMPRMGKDCSSILNKYESDYFNVIFKDKLKGFDLTGKKVGFFTGSNAGTLSNKQKYFEAEMKRFADKSSIISSDLYLFNNEQKNESGGYDAVIVYWSKVLVTYEELVKKLKTDK